jgi:phage terminase large subunit-like protein
MSFHARDVANMSEADRAAFLASLTPTEAEDLQYDWEHWARPEQRLPDGEWINWLILAGRGMGKTRVGAETVRQWVKRYRYVNLIGATADDVRTIMIEGESGILAICPPDERPNYIANKRELHWPNGSKSLLFSAEEPDRLRGKQHEKLWCDELAAWRYPRRMGSSRVRPPSRRQAANRHHDDAAADADHQGPDQGFSGREREDVHHPRVDLR